jgi:hypothetical protein
MSGECMECSYSAWHRAGQMGRPFYNRPRQRGAASPNVDHHVQHQIFRDVADALQFLIA